MKTNSPIDLFRFLDVSPAALRLIVTATVYAAVAFFGVGCAVEDAGTGEIPTTPIGNMGGAAGSAPASTGGAAGSAPTTSTGGSAPVSTGGSPAAMGGAGGSPAAMGGAGGSMVTSTGGAAPTSTGGAGGSAPVVTTKANGAACDVSSACSSGLCCFVHGAGHFCTADRLGCDTGGGVTFTSESRPSTGIDIPCRSASDCPSALVTADHALLGCVGYVAKTRTAPEALGYCSR